VNRAWNESSTGFSLESAYCWIRRLADFQLSLRGYLLRLRGPPQSLEKSGLKGVLEHLMCVFGSARAIEAFQLHFQLGWFEKYPNS
jgi:hypothetical protein